MTGIVERLRDQESQYDGIRHGRICGEAAAEIERLRAALKASSTLLEGSIYEIGELRAKLAFEK